MSIKNNRNLNVEFLRGILMVWIVLYHFTTRYSQLFGVKYPITFDYGGTIGVAIFFILSGYFYFGKIITSECCSFTQVVFFKNQDIKNCMSLTYLV